MSQFKQSIILVLLILVIQFKKLTITQKLIKLENKNATGHDHSKYITTQKFNKLTSGNFNARLAQANVASRYDITNFVKKDIF